MTNELTKYDPKWQEKQASKNEKSSSSSSSTTATETTRQESKNDEKIIETSHGIRKGRTMVLHKAISWDTATEWIKESKLDLFGRSKQQMEKYINQRNLYKEYFESSKDKILVYFFKCSCKVSGKTNKLEAIIDDKITPQYAIGLNDFPYYFDNCIKHYLLFSRIGEMDDNSINKVMDDYLKQNDKNSKYQVQYWRNPPQFQTIPEIWHVHVLVKFEGIKSLY